jgi:hypothetical protein
MSSHDHLQNFNFFADVRGVGETRYLECPVCVLSPHPRASILMTSAETLGSRALTGSGQIGRLAVTCLLAQQRSLATAWKMSLRCRTVARDEEEFDKVTYCLLAKLTCTGSIQANRGRLVDVTVCKYVLRWGQQLHCTSPQNSHLSVPNLSLNIFRDARQSINRPKKWKNAGSSMCQITMPLPSIS